MESNLQRKIKLYLENTGLSIAALERKAGLKTNVARNILRGQSRRPTGETLQAIACVLGCPLQELVQSHGGAIRTEDSGLPGKVAASTVENLDVLNEAFGSILKVIRENDFQVTIQQISFILEEVYAYTIQKVPPNIDEDFVEWFVKRSLR